MVDLINEDHLRAIEAKFIYIEQMLKITKVQEKLTTNMDFLKALFDKDFYQTTALSYFSIHTESGRFCNSKLESIINGYKAAVGDLYDYISRDATSRNFILCILELYTESANQYGDDLDSRYMYELYIHYEIFNTINLEPMQAVSIVKPRQVQSTVKPRPDSASVPYKSKAVLPLARSMSARVGPSQASHIGGGNYGDKCDNEYCTKTLIPIIRQAKQLQIKELDKIVLYPIHNTHGTCNAVAYMTCVINTFKILKKQGFKINGKVGDSCLSRLLYFLITSPDNKYAILDAILYSKNFFHSYYNKGRQFNLFTKMFSTQVTPFQAGECNEKINPIGPINFTFHETFNKILTDICGNDIFILYSNMNSEKKTLTLTQKQDGNIYDLIAFTVDNYNIQCSGHIFAIFKLKGVWTSYEAVITDQEIIDMLESKNECEDILYNRNSGLRYNIKKSRYCIGFYVKRNEQTQQKIHTNESMVVNTEPKPGIIHILGYKSEDLYYAKLQELKTKGKNVYYKSFYNDTLTFLSLISIIIKLKIHQDFTPDSFTQSVMKYITDNIYNYEELYILGEGYGGLVASQILKKYVQNNLHIELDVSTYGSLYVPAITEEVDNISYRHYMVEADKKYAYIEKNACFVDDERCKHERKYKYKYNKDIGDIFNMYKTKPRFGGNSNNVIYYKIKINKINKLKYITYKKKATYLSDIRGKYRYTNDSTIVLCKTMKTR